MRTINKNKVGRSNNQSNNEKHIIKEKKKFLEKVRRDVPDISNFGSLLTSRQEITRILYYNQIYQNLLNKPGVIMEFGVEYGSTLSLLSKFRGIYEPYNYSRKIIGFDTFSGFEKSLIKEEKKFGWKQGDYGVPKGYEKTLEKILNLEEKLSPLSHIKKFELIKGDASKTIGTYLKKNTQTIIGMAIFDMDVYEPTKEVLKSIKNRLFKGSILVFDDINLPEFPGETLALLENIEIRNLKFQSFHGETFGCWTILN